MWVTTHLPSRKSLGLLARHPINDQLSLSRKEGKREKEERRFGRPPLLSSSSSPYLLLLLSSSTFHGDPQLSVGRAMLYPRLIDYTQGDHFLLIWSIMCLFSMPPHSTWVIPLFVQRYRAPSRRCQRPKCSRIIVRVSGQTAYSTCIISQYDSTASLRIFSMSGPDLPKPNTVAIE